MLCILSQFQINKREADTKHTSKQCTSTQNMFSKSNNFVNNLLENNNIYFTSVSNKTGSK